MFLRRYSRTKNGKQHVYFALVESVRTEAGPRQHVVAHLGELNHDQERRWQRTVVFYNRHGEVQELCLFPVDDDSVPASDDPNVLHVRLDNVGWNNARNFGDIWLAHWLWQFLELDQIVARHVSQDRETVAPADIVAIEVINRLCQPCSEFALAERWYASTGLEDVTGVPDSAVTKDRLYRTLDQLLAAQVNIENDLKERLGALFQLEYDLLLYDLTSTYFEGLAEDNGLARRGYSRDHRSDCVQVIIALVVTREGFPLAHYTWPGNTQDLQTVQSIVSAIEARFGTSNRVWVMDRGMISDDALAFLSAPGRRYLLAARRSALTPFQDDLRRPGWQRLPANPDVEVKLLQRDEVHYLLARSKPRRAKERAIRRKQRRGLAKALQKLLTRVAKGRLKKRDKILEAVGRLKERFPKAHPFVTITVSVKPVSLSCVWNSAKFKGALARDGAYLLRSNQAGWSAQEFWETYMQLTIVERAFRVLKSHLLLRPIWHHYSGRTQAHIFICVLAYALWKTLDHLAKRAGLQTLIHKPGPRRGSAAPKPRPMTPEVILSELRQIQIGDILLETTAGHKLALRRIARPNPEQQRILEALQLQLPERLSPDRLL
jgi:Transposase DDE domain